MIIYIKKSNFGDGLVKLYRFVLKTGTIIKICPNSLFYSETVIFLYLHRQQKCGEPVSDFFISPFLVLKLYLLCFTSTALLLILIPWYPSKNSLIRSTCQEGLEAERIKYKKYFVVVKYTHPSFKLFGILRKIGV